MTNEIRSGGRRAGQGSFTPVCSLLQSSSTSEGIMNLRKGNWEKVICLWLRENKGKQMHLCEQRTDEVWFPSDLFPGDKALTNCSQFFHSLPGCVIHLFFLLTNSYHTVFWGTRCAGYHLALHRGSAAIGSKLTSAQLCPQLHLLFNLGNILIILFPTTPTWVKVTWSSITGGDIQNQQLHKSSSSTRAGCRSPSGEGSEAGKQMGPPYWGTRTEFSSPMPQSGLLPGNQQEEMICCCWIDNASGKMFKMFTLIAKNAVQEFSSTLGSSCSRLG